MPPSKNKIAETKGFGKRSLLLLQSQGGKLAVLRRKLIRETIISVVAVLVLTGVYYGVSDWAQERLEVHDKLKAEVDSLSTNVEQLKTKLGGVEKILPVYETAFKNPAKPEILLDRHQAAEIIQKLKDDYLFASLRVGMSPVQDMEDPKFKNKFVIGQYVDVELSIEALSDEHILSFLNQLRKELPGKVKIISFAMTKTNEVNPQILTQITQSGRVGLVRTEIKFRWMGMKLGAAGAGPPAPLPASPPQPAAPGGGA